MMKKKKQKKIIFSHCPKCGEKVALDDFYCKNCKVILTDYRDGRIKIKKI